MYASQLHMLMYSHIVAPHTVSVCVTSLCYIVMTGKCKCDDGWTGQLCSEGK